jgi:hypothetical protein
MVEVGQGHWQLGSGDVNVDTVGNRPADRASPQRERFGLAKDACGVRGVARHKIEHGRRGIEADRRRRNVGQLPTWSAANVQHR